jgi:cell division protease FtsH
MDENPQQGEPKRPDLKFSPPTAVQIFVWVILLAVLPFVFIQTLSGDSKTEKLSSSQFEEMLNKQLITDTVVSHNPSNDRYTITGEFERDGEKKRYEVEVMYTEALEKLIRENSPERKFKRESPLLSNFLMSIVPIVLLVIIIYFLFSRQLNRAGKGAMQFGKSRAKLNQTIEKVTFADLSGIEEAQEEVEEIVDYLRDPDRFHRLGGRLPRGVLMVGPPGTGKTLLARAIAGEADVPFFSISGSDFVEMFVGVGASRVRDMFEQAKKNQPCIIFIDEIDAVGRSRFTGIGGGHDEREQTLNALLVEMDGFEKNTGVIVIAATNRPDVLDPALLRPGRFDRQINVDLPDVKGRFGILKVHSRKVKMSDEVDLETVARGTPGFSGADLANLINEGALLAARTNKNAITMTELEEARDKVCWGKERRSRKVDKHDREVTAYHEAGHALVGLHCEHSTPLHKVTIIPRGNSFLGATIHFPEHDKYTTTRSELMDELTVLMGGRYAEKIIFEEITSGAAMDIKQATSIARRMVCQWGMSDKMGLINYNSSDGPVYVGRDMGRPSELSEQTAREIDDEVKRIIDDVADRALNMLTEHKDQLKALGEALLIHETMDVQEICELLDITPGGRHAFRISEKPELPSKPSDDEPPAASASTDDTGPSFPPDATPATA